MEEHQCKNINRRRDDSDGCDMCPVLYRREYAVDTSKKDINWVAIISVVITVTGAILASWLVLNQDITKLKTEFEIFTTTTYQKHMEIDNERWNELKSDVSSHRKEHEKEYTEMLERIRDIESQMNGLYTRLAERQQPKRYQ